MISCPSEATLVFHPLKRLSGHIPKASYQAVAN